MKGAVPPVFFSIEYWLLERCTKGLGSGDRGRTWLVQLVFLYRYPFLCSI